MNESELSEQRAAFFARTRRAVALLYVVLVIGGAFLAVTAAVADPVRALVGCAIGFIAALLLAGTGLVISFSPRTSRLFVLVGVGLGAAILFADIGRFLATDFGQGVLAGSLLGTAAGVALLRRQLSTDDELWLRQRELGWTEDPWGWIRRR